MELFLSFLAGLFLGILLAFLGFIKKFVDQNRKIADLNAENKSFAGLNVQDKLFTEFENAANKLLKQNSDEFSKLGKKEIEDLIKPFREKIVELSQRIEKNRFDEAKELSSLETHIKLLAQNNQRISEEANNLAKAIKGDSKIRGNWGEIVLERLLETSGLQKGIHYSSQESFKDNEGNFLRPDVIIYMPNNRHLVLDSKVSLISFEKYYNSEEEKEKHLKEFINSVREHIKNLKNKFYKDIKEINSPDFVLMFIPIESSFSLIMQNDSDLFDFARKSGVLPVSSSTLLVTLKTIELFWQRESQSQNVKEIAEESGKLYDKFVGLLTDVDVLRNCFSKTLNCFENLNKKLDGRGGLISQAEKIKLLGAKTTKEITDKIFIEH
ncbi:MAG TPA: DNA recombination protein RmuC [Candidatus Gastranaerophilales bacterium]|nr:DNA recombination protein RmuC [Candidatus Gastranaerophilales bacterium]